MPFIRTRRQRNWHGNIFMCDSENATKSIHLRLVNERKYTFPFQIIIWTPYFTDIPLVVMGCNWFTYTRRSTSLIVRLDFFLWGYMKRLKLLTSSESLSEIVRGKGASKIDRMICGRFMGHIYDTPVETEGV